MSVLFTDNFNRADAADVGASWSVPTGFVRFGIVSNACAPSDLTGSDDAEYVNAVTPPDDQYAQGKVTNTITTNDTNFNGVGVAVRMATGAQTMYAALTVNARTKLMEMNAGASSHIASSVVAWVDGDTLYLEAQGDDLVVKINGSAVITQTDATITSGRFGVAHGTSAGASLASIDDFEGGDFVVGGGGISIPVVMHHRMRNF